MCIGRSYKLVLLCVELACAEAANPPGEICPNCPAEPVAELLIDSPLPDALGSACARAPSGLEALLLGAYAEGTCELTIASESVSGTCTNVAVNQNPALTLLYRTRGSRIPIAEQNRVLEIPEDKAGGSIDVTFAGRALERPYDSDSDGTDNASEWCAATL